MSFVRPNPNAIKEMAAQNENDLIEFMKQFVKFSKMNTPVLTGLNRTTIDFARQAFLFFWLFTESGYGGWLNNGTVRTPAQPYINPAFPQTVSHFKGTPLGRGWKLGTA